MIKTAVFAAIAGGSGFMGWLGGSIWPAPPEWTDAINRTANDLRAKVRLENISFAGLRDLVPAETFNDLQQSMNDVAVAAGELIVVERDNGTLEEQLDNLALDQQAALPAGMEVVDVPAAAPSPPPGPETAPSGAQPPSSDVAPAIAPPPVDQPALPEAGVTPPPLPPTQLVVVSPVASDPTQVFSASLRLCPRMDVSNAPRSSGGVVSDYRQMVRVKDARIATHPTAGACLSSGFGPRNDRLHKGLDFHSDTGATIFAGGAGEIVEMKYRADYGNMLLIDHGGGVYTRYAHLASFGRGLSPGVVVGAGEPIGLMGNSADYQIPIHLHYELLVGDIANPKGSFGLEPVNPLTFPAAE